MFDLVPSLDPREVQLREPGRLPPTGWLDSQAKEPLRMDSCGELLYYRGL